VESRVALERNNALIDVQQQCREYGKPVTVSLRAEAQIQRDAYGSRKGYLGDTVLQTHAFPWTESPSRRNLERVGLAGTLEGIDAVASTPTKDWTDAGLGFDRIDPGRVSVMVGGQRYAVASRGQASAFADSHLYITLALRRE
jgi:hypothetical protein